MAKKLPSFKELDSIVHEDPEGGPSLTLPESVRGNVGVVRYIHDQLVDFMSNHRLAKSLLHDMEMRLTVLSFAIVGEYVIDLVRQARAATRKPKKSKAPKKGAKRKRK